MRNKQQLIVVVETKEKKNKLDEAMLSRIDFFYNMKQTNNQSINQSSTHIHCLSLTIQFVNSHHTPLLDFLKILRYTFFY